MNVFCETPSFSDFVLSILWTLGVILSRNPTASLAGTGFGALGLAAFFFAVFAALGLLTSFEAAGAVTDFFADAVFALGPQPAREKPEAFVDVFVVAVFFLAIFFNEG